MPSFSVVLMYAPSSAMFPSASHRPTMNFSTFGAYFVAGVSTKVTITRMGCCAVARQYRLLV